MGFTRAAKTCFGGSQFRFCRLQLRGTCSSGFGRLIGGAFGFAHRLNRLGQRCGSSIAPCRQGGFAFRQRGIFFSDARARGIGIARKGWLTKDDVLNTLPLAQVRNVLQAKRTRS